MNKVKELEYKLWTRRIKAVLEWHDPMEQDFPWSYVERTGDGRYELFTCVLLKDGESDFRAEPVSLGLVTTPAEAQRTLRCYNNASRALGMW